MTHPSPVYFLKPDQYRSVPQAMVKAGVDKIVKKGGLTAIKLHFGEKGNIGYIKPELIKPIIKQIQEIGGVPFVTDANTIYKGERSDAVRHLMIAAVHNYHPKFLGVPVIIADGLRGNNYTEVDVNLKHFKKIKIAEAIYNSDAIVAVSHFKGHPLCGIGGAIKNIGMGCAPRAGKKEQHSDSIPLIDSERCTLCGNCIKWCASNAISLKDKVSIDKSKCAGCGQCITSCASNVFSMSWDGKPQKVQEKVAEYAFGILKDRTALYINFLTFITPLCDCLKTVSKPIMPDIGILISRDPVAIDQASLDLTNKHVDGKTLKEATGIDGEIQIKYAEKLGLGCRKYDLIPL